MANIASNCYLCSWSLVNISCFHSAYVSSTSWRPKFKYYNKWISLFCSLLCVVLMFCFDWISAVCLISVMIIIKFFIHKYKPGIDEEVLKFFNCYNFKKIIISKQIQYYITLNKSSFLKYVRS